MTELDHDVYSINEAAGILRRTETDIVKWGSSGKIELGVLFSGTIAKGYIEKDDSDFSPYESYPVTEEKIDIYSKLMVIEKVDLLELYKKNVASKKHDIPVEVYRFKAKPGRFNEIDKIQGGDNHIPLYYSDLFIHGKELKRFKKTLNDSEDTQQPTTKDELPPYLDPKHDNFSEELCVAIEAWIALYQNHSSDKPKVGHKKYIENWLREHHPDLSGNGIKRVAIVVNPHKEGGAPRS